MKTRKINMQKKNITDGSIFTKTINYFTFKQRKLTKP